MTASPKGEEGVTVTPLSNLSNSGGVTASLQKRQSGSHPEIASGEDEQGGRYSIRRCEEQFLSTLIQAKPKHYLILDMLVHVCRN